MVRGWRWIVSIVVLWGVAVPELDSRVVINEVLASNARTNIDEDRDSSDWVEFKNVGDAPVDMNGYFLSDTLDDLRQWTFPDVTLQPGEYLLVWCSGKDRAEASGVEQPTPVAHWPLDAGQGTRFSNTVDSEFDGYLAPGTTVSWRRVEADSSGNRPPQEFCVLFSGEGSYIQTDYPGIAGSNPRTIACWIRTESSGANDILGFGRPVDGLKWHMRVNMNASDGPLGAVRTEYQGGQNIGTVRIDDGRWHHVAASLPEGSTNGHGIDHYVDGILQGKAGADRAISTDTSDPFYNLTIGLTRQSTTSFRYYNGWISDVRVYDQALGEEGVRAIMEGDEPPPVLVARQLHTNFQVSANGELIILSNEHQEVVDFVELPGQHRDISYARSPDGTGPFFYHTSPTPREENAGSASEVPLVVADTKFEPNRGFYESSFSVEITTVTEGASIRYTLDGSAPSISHGIEYEGPIAVSDTTTIRAVAYKAGHRSTDVDTHTYIFLETPEGGGVIHQPVLPHGFPTNWGPNGGTRDYEMDPHIATNPDSPHYDPRVKEALMALPSVSLVMNVEDLFDPETGIYSNPEQRGIEWERACSVEFIYPDDPKAGHQTTAGLRMQGNASRRPSRPKHNMRLIFKRIYGDGKLRHALFEDTSIDEFDEIILRGGNGDSWFHPSATQQQQAQYIRDQWHRDIEFAMGRLTAHQRHMHLYLNGLYWGLFHIFERPTGSFLASHLGGQRQDWDAHNSLDPLDGDLVAWNEMMSIAEAGVADAAGYAELQEYLSVPNLIDFMLINFYSGNIDWDRKNWYAARRREPGAGYVFFTWDSERTFLGLTDNRTSQEMAGRPSRLHQLLAANPEYRMLFADHVRRHFFADGVLTPEKAIEFWMARADEIRLPLIAESARFGDNKRSQPYTVDREWSSELRRVTNDYMPRRTGIVLAQLRARGLFPNVDAPTFDRLGGHIDSEIVLSVTARDGEIFYTTDSADPRLAGGAVSPRATRATERAELLSKRPLRSGRGYAAEARGVR